MTKFFFPLSGSRLVDKYLFNNETKLIKMKSNESLIEMVLFLEHTLIAVLLINDSLLHFLQSNFLNFLSFWHFFFFAECLIFDRTCKRPPSQEPSEQVVPAVRSSGLLRSCRTWDHLEEKIRVWQLWKNCIWSSLIGSGSSGLDSSLFPRGRIPRREFHRTPRSPLRVLRSFRYGREIGDENLFGVRSAENYG